MIQRVLVRGAALGVAALALTGLGAIATMLSDAPERADANAAAPTVDSTSVLATMEGELAATRGELDRAHRILEFSGRYRIPADLAARIYDHATEAGLPAALGFQLVKIESNFENTARSYAAAIGLTQLRLLTARSYEPTIAASDLMNPDVNLRIGFSYLRDLLKQFDNDLPLALEAYNKGPTLVTSQLEEGLEVRGRYSRAVMGGMRKGS
ncbi:MAG: transglycosylase SLT domain-containing protein [Gemmatimonadales bacterium]|nr:transglycosylase SLT domain-containing protein [Gemmatimonadota bacterium]MCB9518545.1 transglycosylase SLT domain-containing protein [Gemmatimonadales bacterium]HPF61205.1 transglycosylase SLT domain-containing protein [Gemmatimonadales bacterium]HRX18682.1 transglycosylase SLT domain-containing protein [Gemmatimonadales bacterium]